MRWKDILRPTYGTVMLQPLTILWCWLFKLDYLAILGPFTIISTIYLMPVYLAYENLWNKKEMIE
tara:strand:- start:5950 stop:6144 length:195 start_codon:yes stop_codon:yes gene_type:complete